MDWDALWVTSDDFVGELCDYVGIPRDHPKRTALWNIAYDRGHSGGIVDVVIYFEEMAELLK